MTHVDYDSLPLNEKTGKRSCWGIWDKDGELDHLGGASGIFIVDLIFVALADSKLQQL